MAGKGSRFIEAGYTKPKPLIDVMGKSMIERVLECVPDDNRVFLILKEHLTEELRRILRGKIIEVDKLTEGAVCTVLLAEHLITDEELIILNCDQILNFDYDKFINYARTLDGCIMTFQSTEPSHSYSRVVDGRVVEVAEKKVISDKATAGLYYFRKGSDFVKAAHEMIKKNIRVNNEFYICPVYQELIDKGKNIGVWELNDENCSMLGTPEELQEYINSLAYLISLN